MCNATGRAIIAPCVIDQSLRIKLRSSERSPSPQKDIRCRYYTDLPNTKRPALWCQTASGKTSLNCAKPTVPSSPQADKWKSGWVAPAILQDGATSRKLIDVERMAAWIGLDLDHANWTLRQAISRFSNLTCIIYSTTRSTYLERRWRVILPLSREMTTAEFAGVWKAWNVLLDGEVDASTKNLNRLHYLPSTWYDEDGVFGNNEYHVQDGQVMDVDDLLMICPPEDPTYYTEVYQTDGVQRPDGTDIITEAMIQKHMTQGKVGGRFFDCYVPPLPCTRQTAGS